MIIFKNIILTKNILFFWSYSGFPLYLFCEISFTKNKQILDTKKDVAVIRAKGDIFDYLPIYSLFIICNFQSLS